MGLDGGGPPPAETGAVQPQNVDPKPSITTEAKPPNPILAERKEKIISILGNERFNAYENEEFQAIKDAWINKTTESLDPTLEIAEAIGIPEVPIPQDFRASTDLSTPEGKFAAVYLASFGAKANLGGDVINVSPSNIGEIVNDRRIIKVTQKQDELPETDGTALVLDNAGKPRYLIVETDTAGLRIMIDGSSVIIPNQPGGDIVPMMLVKTEEGGLRKDAQENIEAIRQRFSNEEDKNKRAKLLVLLAIILGFAKEFLTGSTKSTISQQSR